MKIKFHELYTKTLDIQRRDGSQTYTVEPAHVIQNILRYINGLPLADISYDLSGAKYCRLSLLEDHDEGILFCCLRSAKRGFRPPLWDRQTGEERDNPKNLSEGEVNKTHFAIRYRADEVLVAMEDNRSGVSMRQLVEYIWFFAHQYHASLEDGSSANYQIEFSTLAKDNFIEEIERLNRVISFELLVDKQILGTEALNFSNRTDSVKEDVTITVKAERSQSIKDTAIDAYRRFAGQDTRIHKVKAIGRNRDNNSVVVDTSFIEKVEFLEVNKDEQTGEINTDGVRARLIQILRQL
ncbi:hypothetical protein D770_04735 [Flammeovirgaceae bacterium 311]|nr:hypothetical protein D770_04735 [Flammeovirgaceae bacterium 311]